ncbi:MAG: LacI family DNA-binding transcriptional regulator [Actinobacteria bacterium]|nr:LacI family DNA-binding transcriptional regulator [Actinomycetota bacterium]
MHDVAARAGVSKSLVSLAMRGSPKVSERSRSLILAAAAELGYRPNAAARSLADRRSHTVGVLVLDLHNPVFAEILDGVQSEVRTHGYSTMLVTGGADPDLEQAELEKLLEFQVEGLIVIAHRLPGSVLRRIAKECPLVVVTRDDVTGPSIDTVRNDDVAGARLAVEHLVALGHRRIVHLSGGDNRVSQDRRDGYLEAMRTAGLAGQSCVIDGALTDAGGYSAAQQALDLEPRPTAMFAANDMSALGAIAAVQDRGLGVPGDVSVVGYDGMSLGALRTLSLTTVAQPLGEMGALAARRLFDRIDHPRRRSVRLRVDAALVPRGSTAPPRRSDHPRG